MIDELGTRMKEFYENRTRIFLPRRTYTIIRIDGKAFHTYTKGLEKPFDKNLFSDMDETACYLCKNIQGTKLAYVQSDEISILLTDFDRLNTSAWFDGSIQKICSVSASLATSKFNQLRVIRRIQDTAFRVEVKDIEQLRLAEFDARTFTIPSAVEVKNYFIWRQQDAERNSIQSLAQCLYSHKELNGKNTNEMQDMCFTKGINWNDFPVACKRGRIIIKDSIVLDNGAIRTKWIADGAPRFITSQLFDNIGT